MRKIGLILLALTILGAGLCFADGYKLAFYPQYWIIGNVPNAADGTSPNGVNVYFFRSTPECNAGLYSVDIVGLTGTGDRANRFMINTFSIGLSSLDIGQTYSVGIPNSNPSDPTKGYGADPITVKITGTGLDEISGPLVYRLGGGQGINPPANIQEPLPIIKIWFGNRLYQPQILKAGEEFVISAKPDIRVDIAEAPPFTLAGNLDAHSIRMDSGDPLPITASNVSKIFASGTEPSANQVSSMSIKYPYPTTLTEGKHIFSVSSSSSGLLAPATTASEVANVSVLGGPVRMIGIPICYPSPFSISKQKTMFIQYELSADANIEIYLIGVSGQRVKKFVCLAGQEGGAAGINKVQWDGRSDMGSLAGNAIYVGTIIAKDEGRLLGKVKATLVD
jgi:hypothetical protein